MISADTGSRGALEGGCVFQKLDGEKKRKCVEDVVVVVNVSVVDVSVVVDVLEDVSEEVGVDVDSSFTGL